MNQDEQVEMQLAKWLADRPREVGELAVELRKEVVKLAPGTSELLYNAYAVSNVFTYTGKLGQAFIHIATYAQHVNLGFNQGAKLNDPDSLLQGTGKLIRHVRIDKIGTAQKKNVIALVKAAIRQGIEMAEKSAGIQEQAFEVKSK